MATQVTQHSAVALTYARALIELAQAQGAHEAVGQELADLKQVLESDPAFGLFLRDPAIGTEERRAVIDRALRPQLTPLVANFLGVVNQHGRTGILPEVIDAYRDLLDKVLGNVDVEVTVARELTDEQLAQVRERVSAALKKNAVVRQRVDESIVGGLVLKVEDKLLDASVKSQLAALKEQLLAKRPR